MAVVVRAILSLLALCRNNPFEISTITPHLLQEYTRVIFPNCCMYCRSRYPLLQSPSNNVCDKNEKPMIEKLNEYFSPLKNGFNNFLCPTFEVDAVEFSGKADFIYRETSF